jgi:RNA polymerase sigma factor (sigma-70 family)
MPSRIVSSNMGHASAATFTAFVDEHGDKLARFARLLTANPHDAEDLLQVALMRVYRHWPLALDSPLAYTKTTIVNLSKDGYRRSPRIPTPVAELGDATTEQSPDIDDAITAQARIESLLVQLPPRQRVTVVLRVLDGHSTEEVAAQMSCSEGTVKSNFARGLDRLRAIMNDESNALINSEVHS